MERNSTHARRAPITHHSDATDAAGHADRGNESQAVDRCTRDDRDERYVTVIAKIVLVVNVRGGITNGNGERTKRGPGKGRRVHRAPILVAVKEQVRGC